MSLSHELSSNSDEFLRQWELLCSAALAAPARALGARLLDLYSTPTCHYHNAAHIIDCLRLLSPLNAREHDVLALAIFFHDAIYDPKRGDNEEKSAELAAAWLQPFASASTLTQVYDLILATRHQAPPRGDIAAVMVDIDLSILGRPQKDFLAYDAAIRAEYGHVPEGAYRVGRAKVLRAFLARPRIYQTDAFVKNYEAVARNNLAAAITRLQAE